MSRPRLRRYRLACTISGPRCDWRSRSWRDSSPWAFPPDAWERALSHARTRHGIHDGRATPVRTHFTVRRWRPWLRCTLLAGAVLLLLAGITAAAVTIDVRGWW